MASECKVQSQNVDSSQHQNNSHWLVLYENKHEGVMFDLFGGVTAEQVNQSNQAHAVNYMAIVLVLVEKGIVSQEELSKARVQATHFVEQEWARKHEEAVKEFDEEHPGLRRLFGKVLGMPADENNESKKGE